MNIIQYHLVQFKFVYFVICKVTAREELSNPVEENPERVDRHTQQSRRIPYWLWFIIAKSLGIKLQEGDKPIVATVLYTLTFMSALGR